MEDVVVVDINNKTPLYVTSNQQQLVLEPKTYDKVDYDYEPELDVVDYESWSNAIRMSRSVLIGFNTPYNNKNAPCRAQPELRPNII